MADNLALNSLRIRRFRGLDQLEIKRLGRVNLIVGKNNVGKTTLLEALRLYCRPGSFEEINNVLATRDGTLLREIDRRLQILDANSMNHLFFGHKPLVGENGSIVIGPMDSSERTLSMRIDIEEAIFKVLEVENSRAVSGREDVPVPVYRFMVEKRAGLFCQFGKAMRFFPIGEQSISYYIPPPLDQGMVRPFYPHYEQNFPSLSHLSISANGLESQRAQQLWDGISLSPHEHDVLQALQLIAPSIERLAFKEREDDRSNYGESKPRDRIPFVKLKNYDDPIPLSTLGDGVHRLFGIILSMIYARNGLLLIDEIENGIHYSIQADLWHHIFTLAQSLNVQIFATSHSWDMVKAFQQAASESEEDGVLVRLARKGNQILVAEFDEADLEVVVDSQIEVR